MPPSGFAVHEAAHAVGFLAAGGKVVHLQVDAGRGGLCEVAGYQQPAPAGYIVALHAGPLAAQAYGRDGEGTELSAGDRAALDRQAAAHLTDTGHAVTPYVASRLEDQASLLVWERKGEILYLAAKLDEKKTLGITDLTTLCNAPGSPLGAYAGLYPAAPSPPAEGGARPRAVAAGVLE